MQYESLDSKGNPATSRTWDELTGDDKIPEKFQFGGGFKSEDQAKREFHQEGEDNLKKAA